MFDFILGVDLVKFSITNWYNVPVKSRFEVFARTVHLIYYHCPRIKLCFLLYFVIMQNISQYYLKFDYTKSIKHGLPPITQGILIIYTAKNLLFTYRYHHDFEWFLEATFCPMQSLISVFLLKLD